MSLKPPPAYLLEYSAWVWRAYSIVWAERKPSVGQPALYFNPARGIAESQGFNYFSPSYLQRVSRKLLFIYQLAHNKQRSPKSKSLIFDVLRNVWDSHLNPDGFFNYLTYNDGGGGSMRLKQGIAHFMNRHFSPVRPIELSHLVVTNSVSSEMEHLAWAFTNPGDGILPRKPYYGQFIPGMKMRTAAEVVPFNFNDCDAFEEDAVELYEQALLEFESRSGNKVRALVVCNPHDPLGRSYPEETIIGFMKLCQRHQIHLISDEVYALSTWDDGLNRSPAPAGFRSVLSIDVSDIVEPGLVYVLWGMSKDFGPNGIRIGAIISQASADVHTILGGAPVYPYVSGLSDYIAATILMDDEFTDRYIEMNQQRLRDNYYFVAAHNLP